MIINLTSYELMTASHVGIMRQVQSLKKRSNDMYGADKNNGWQLHIEGALGECAVAKAIDLYWSGSVGNFSGGDVGKIEVRTRSKHNYDLILHNSDSDSAWFVLVTGVNGKYVVGGCILGRDGKLDKFWSDPAGNRPAYFVPQSALLPIASLLKEKK